MAYYRLRRERRIPSLAGLDWAKIIGPAANSFLEFLTERAQLNAPIKSGRLRSEIKYRPVSVNYRGAWQMNLVSGAPYSSWMHENTYKLGPRSAAQPDTIEGGVGRKFLTRVADYWFREGMFQRKVMQAVEEQAIKLGFKKE